MNITNNIKTYYINLDNNIDRKNNIEKMLSIYDFKNIERYPASNTKTYENLLKQKNIYEQLFNTHIIDDKIIVNLLSQQYRNSNEDISFGAIGCYLSHLGIYKKIVDNNINYALIFEDDYKISGDPKQFWDKIGKIKIPIDTDIYLLDYVLLDYDDITNDHIDINFFYQLHCYIITKKGAEKCLQKLLPIEMQIDAKMSRLSYLKHLNIYGYPKNNLHISQGSFTTNIQNECERCNIVSEINIFKIQNQNIIKIHGTIYRKYLLLLFEFFRSIYFLFFHMIKNPYILLYILAIILIYIIILHMYNK